MTEQEATKELERHIQYLRANWKPHPDYNVIEALGMAINALEKQIPKKPKEHCDDKELHYCPCCWSYFGGTTGWERCWKCGQKLDWEEVTE